MRTRFRKLLVGLCALAALSFGAAAISQAGSSPAQKSPEPAANSATDPDNVQDENGKDDANEASEKGEKDDEGKKGEEADQLVSGGAASSARQAAEAETGGKAGDVERDSEHGATYEVEVTKADGSEVDVYLDGQFKVVSVDADDNEQAK